MQLAVNRQGRQPEEDDADGNLAEEYKVANLKKELSMVRDPLKLAHKVVNMLKRDGRDDYNKALALVRLASKDMPCTVSWNHLIGYNMSKYNVKLAVGVYNEVCDEKAHTRRSTYVH